MDKSDMKLEEHEVKCPTCEKIHCIELDISESSYLPVHEENFCSGGCWDIKRG